MKTILPFVFLSAITTCVHAQAPFQSLLGAAGSETGSCAAQTSDGGYVIGATTTTNATGTSDALFIRLDNTGSLVWSRQWHGGLDDRPYDIAVQPNGEIWACGSSDPDSDGLEETFLLAMNGSGDLLWSRSIESLNRDVGFGLTLTADGGAVVTNLAQPGGQSSVRFGLTRFDAAGNVTSSTGVRGPDNTYGGGVIELANGELLCVGTTGLTGTGVYHTILFRTDSAGAPISGHQFVDDPTVSESVYAMDELGDGTVIMAGTTGDDVLVIRSDTAGSVLWSQRISRPGHFTRAFAMGRTSDDAIYIAVHDYSGPSADMALIKMDLDGNEIWQRTYGSGVEDRVQKAIQTSDGGYLIVGTTEGYTAQGFDILLLRTEADGLPPAPCDTLPEEFIFTPMAHVASPVPLLAVDVLSTTDLGIASPAMILTSDNDLCELGTGANEISGAAAHPRVFPIPANDVLHVPLDNLTLEPVQARLMNALGSVVIEDRWADAQHTLDVSGLAPGQYVLSLIKGGSVYSVPVVIAR